MNAAQVIGSPSAEKLLTAEEYAALPPSDWPTELVRGKIVEMNVPRPRHGRVCSRATHSFENHVEQSDCGRVFCNDAGFIVRRNPDTVRGPDVSYYSYQRVPREHPLDRYFEIAPEIAVEVRSPDDRWPEVLQKIAEFLQAGVVWACVVDPASETAHLYHAEHGVRILSADEELTFPDILPGFALTVRDLFA